MNVFQHIATPLICMATGLIFFMGFLPVQKIPSRFFVFHTIIAATLWLLVYLQDKNSVFLIITVTCAMAWHNFRSNKVPTGKMFLALASGLAVGFGLFRTGLVQAPAILPASWSNFWVLSILLSSALLGSCYIALMVGGDFNKTKEIGQDMFERSLHIFLGALALRAVLFLAMAISIWTNSQDTTLYHQWFDFSQLGSVVLSRVAMGLFAPAAITMWGLSQLKHSPSSFKLVPFYVVIFLVLWGEMSAYRIGF